MLLNCTTGKPTILKAEIVEHYVVAVHCEGETYDLQLKLVSNAGSDKWHCVFGTDPLSLGDKHPDTFDRTYRFLILPLFKDRNIVTVTYNTHYRNPR